MLFRFIPPREDWREKEVSSSFSWPENVRKLRIWLIGMEGCENIWQGSPEDREKVVKRYETVGDGYFGKGDWFKSCECYEESLYVLKIDYPKLFQIKRIPATYRLESKHSLEIEDSLKTTFVRLQSKVGRCKLSQAAVFQGYPGKLYTEAREAAGLGLSQDRENVCCLVVKMEASETIGTIEEALTQLKCVVGEGYVKLCKETEEKVALLQKKEQEWFKKLFKGIGK